MTERLHVPPIACPTCPYRRDTPPGIWAPVEYEKLRTFRNEQPGELPELAVFRCHQSNATGRPTVCRGWLSTRQDIVAVRMACAFGMLDVSDVPREAEPIYYSSGNEAADAGLAGVSCPPPDAIVATHRLRRKGAARWEDEDTEDDNEQ